MKLIDKVITKIKEMLNKEYPCDNSEQEVGYASALYELEDFIDTLEVKEVDLEEELDKYTTNNFWALEGNSESPYLVEKEDMLKIAKHFYELGLKAQKGE